MKLVSKIAAGAALLGAITAAQAEQMVFGAVVEPIMSLEVDGRILPADAWLSGADADAAPTAASPTVGVFRVVSNVEKWNVKMQLANGGYLETWSGRAFTTSHVADGEIGNAASTSDFYVCAVALNANSYVCGTSAPAAGDGFQSVDGGTLADRAFVSEVIDLDAAIGELTDGTTNAGVYDDVYIYNDGVKTTSVFELHSWVNGASVTALAGTYTETLNLSLYGSY
jgi:hypothetical protein